jgi:hypothetical protein
MNLTPLDEHRLTELKQVVAARVLADARRPRWRLLRPALAIAATTGATAIALVATGGGGGTPAFAVTRNAAGVVTVTLTDYRHTAQLSQELRRLGVPAAVFYIPQGQYCYEGSAREVPDPPKGLYTVPTALPAGDGWQLRISTALLKPGQTLLFGLSIGTTKLPRDHPPGVRSNKFYASSTYLITGQATACQFRPEPPAQVPPQVANSGRTVVVDEAGEFLFPHSVRPAASSGK